MFNTHRVSGDPLEGLLIICRQKSEDPPAPLTTDLPSLRTTAWLWPGTNRVEELL